MGAVVKNPIPQLAQGSGPGLMSALFLDQSLARIPTINANEIQHWSHFLPVIVLIDQSIIENLAVPCKIAVSKFLPETSESTKLLGLFGQAME